jgi:hypothetical protein
MYEKHQKASEELKSLRLITNMLREEINTLRNQQDVNKASREEPCNQRKDKKESAQVQCLSVVCTQVSCEHKQNQPKPNYRSGNIENLESDLRELIEIRRSASRQYVREVISSDINLLTHRIESLKDDVSHKESTETQWTEVVAGRRKFPSHTRHSEFKPIPVIRNQFEVLNNYYPSEYANSDPVRIQPLVRKHKPKASKTMKMKHKILIIGDSHAHGIASEILHNLDDDFAIQGIVKSGSDLAEITHTAIRDTGALTKQDVLSMKVPTNAHIILL